MHVGYDIYKWICVQLWLNEKVATMVQIDGHKRNVYINFRDKGTGNTLRLRWVRRCDLIDVPAKCRALFIATFRDQGYRWGSLTAEWLNVQASLTLIKNLRTYWWSVGPWNIYAFIFTNGCIRNRRGRPKQDSPCNEVCMTPCELWVLQRGNKGKCTSCNFSQSLNDNKCGSISTT